MSDNSAITKEVFQADQSIQGPIPDIRTYPEKWFKYFDHNKLKKNKNK